MLFARIAFRVLLEPKATGLCIFVLFCLSFVPQRGDMREDCEVAGHLWNVNPSPPLSLYSGVEMESSLPAIANR